MLTRALAAFGYRDFRVLWFGAFTSTVGNWMQEVAQAWLVFDLTKSSFFLGLDDFLGQLPILLFTLIGGVVADRHDRRHVLLGSQYIQMSTAFTLAALVYLGAVRVCSIVLLLSFVGGSRAGVRRARVSVADSLARQEAGPAERDRAQLHPVQPGARVRPAARGRHARGVGAAPPASPQRPVVPRRDRRAHVAARSNTSRRVEKTSMLHELKGGLRYAKGQPAIIALTDRSRP